MIGERVRLAREACCFTQQELANSAEITQAALSSIEAGRILTPSEDVIKKIANATQFPISFFYLGGLPDLPEGNYRQRASTTSKEDKQLRAQVHQIVEFVQRAEQRLNLPEVTISSVNQPSTLNEIEIVANNLRNALGVGARDSIPNLIRAVERTGVIVVRLPTILKKQDGFSIWPDFAHEGRPIIALSAGHSGDRDRFNIGHELGHLIFHAKRPYVERHQAEQEANRLSGALLLPLRSAIEALRPPVTLRVLMAIKANYGISIAATAQRAKDLNLISHDQFISIRKQLAARKWLRAEPVEVPQEKPLLISKIIDSLAGAGSTTQKAERLAMPKFAYRALAS